MSIYFKVLEAARRRLEALVDRDVVERLSQIPNRLNEYGYDAWGFCPEEAKYFYSLAALLYRHYFRVETFGIEQVPAGRVLLIANHGGQLPFDGLMLSSAMLLEAKPPRVVRGMAEKWFPTLPVMSWLMPRLGHVVGTPHNCVQLLEHDEAVMVFPEGVRGSGKLWHERYRLKAFGRGFMRLALQTRTPIVPVGIVGSEEQSPGLLNVRALGRLIGAPAFPITPTFPFLGPAGFVPLPVKFRLHFGAPMRFEGDASDEDEVIEAKVEEVRCAIRELVELGLRERRTWFT